MERSLAMTARSPLREGVSRVTIVKTLPAFPVAQHQKFG
jgi:hypothetical protein